MLCKVVEEVVEREMVEMEVIRKRVEVLKKLDVKVVVFVGEGIFKKVV